jgi:hypothetical protein
MTDRNRRAGYLGWNPGTSGATIAPTCIFVAVEYSPSNLEVAIRRFTVGLLALAAIAAAGFLLVRRRPPLTALPGGQARKPVDDLYAAGL